jgi:Tol biopolymer transport system component
VTTTSTPCGADGSHQRNLTQSPGIQDKWPDWSQDGHRIVFGSNRDGDREIFTTRLDGTRVRQLTFNTGLEDGFPAWSPNGNKIAYTSASTPGQDMFGSWEIHTMRADGRKQTRLTQNTALDFQPAWSPDGSRIVFTSFRDGNGEIYTMQADGRHQVNQTRNSAFDIDPDWQPLPMQHRRVNG